MDIYDILILITFVIGYFLITIEHTVRLNKTSIALLMAMICWAIQFLHHGKDSESNLADLAKHISDVSQIVFFLLGALIIVEIINAHKGFRFILDYIQVHSKRKLLWIVGIITFFLSSVLDNLTTTVIMVSLMRKLTSKGEDRLLMGGAIVIAANAGGAWTPIGDVTTTMLWIGGQLSTMQILRSLFLPSLACLVVALLWIGLSLKGQFSQEEMHEHGHHKEPMGKLVFWIGLACLVFVPIFKLWTGLPPAMGMLLGLSLMWLLTDLVHSRYDHRNHLRVPYIMSQIDISSVLFFLGILLCINALDSAGILHILAQWMDYYIVNPDWIAIAIGLISAVVDNVPLVAAAMGMYELTQYPPDSRFWDLVAYCAGTGGSILVIGSAAGVAFMGLEKVRFFWYARRISLAAFLGYFSGIGVYQLMSLLNR